jgi:hypothetical protein
LLERGDGNATGGGDARVTALLDELAQGLKTLRWRGATVEKRVDPSLRAKQPLRPGTYLQATAGSQRYFSLAKSLAIGATSL